MYNYSLIPDLNNIDKSVRLAERYSLGFEYNEFTRPEIYDNPDEIEQVIDVYKGLNRDRSHDTMHGAFLGVDIAAEDPLIKNRSRELCKQSLEIADRLGIKGVVFHTGLIGTLRIESYVNKWIDDAVEFFGSLSDEYSNIEIYMENSFEQEPDVFVRLMERMSNHRNFGLCLDYSHAVLTATAVDKWVEAFSPYIRHMHLNDNDLKDDLHQAIGDGKIDFCEWKNLMEKYYIKTSVLLEMNGLDLVEKSLEYIKDSGSYVNRAKGMVKTSESHEDSMSDVDDDEGTKGNRLKRILDIGIALSKERDPNRLLSYILDTAMDLTNCDGGSLYVLKDDGLHFAIMKTKSKGVNRVFAEHFFGEENDSKVIMNNLLPPIELKEENVCAYAAIHKKSLNISDAYASSLFDFSGPKSNDEKNDYRTKSMVAIPMIDHTGEVIGVMQLINAMDENGNTVDFTKEEEKIISSLASQTAICISNMTFIRELDKQMWSFTEAMTEVIDMRTPYNGNHTKQVAKYAEMIARKINELHEVGETETCFSEEHISQVVMAAYLHDLGKMITPIKVMNKKTRLENHIEEIKWRFESFLLKNEIDFLKGKIEEPEYAKMKGKVEKALEVAKSVDSDRPLTEEQEKLIDEVAPLFSEEEVDCMKIKRGTLTDSERQIMQDHVVITKKILDKVHFNHTYKMAPVWAAQHHECVNGTGYPLGLSDKELGVEARILAVADICDALLATDRPYKKPMPKEVAFRIMKDMAKEGKIDIRIVEYLEECLR